MHKTCILNSQGQCFEVTILTCVGRIIYFGSEYYKTKIRSAGEDIYETEVQRFLFWGGGI